jgi:cytoskeletal protein RodZ
MKFNLKTIILVALFVFYLVIILSNLFIREGLENKDVETTSEEMDATPTPSASATATSSSTEEATEETTEESTSTPGPTKKGNETRATTASSTKKSAD